MDRLSADLRCEFPEIHGFSPRNLKYMRSFAQAWPRQEFVQEVLAQLPWYHHIALLDKLDHSEDRLWYLHKALENGWSRNVMVMQMESNAKASFGAAQNNFATTLPKPQSDLARETLKDPYRFGFSSASEHAQEREVESALVHHVTEFLLELGAGFAYVINRQMKSEFDQPTIGLLLCKCKNKVVAEYALGDKTQPMGIAEYKLENSLPEVLKTSLPTIEQIEKELEGADHD